MMNVNKLHETLNNRACMILEIEQLLKSAKVPVQVDLSYLDSLDDSMLDAIYKMVKRDEE